MLSKAIDKSINRRRSKALYEEHRFWSSDFASGFGAILKFTIKAKPGNARHSMKCRYRKIIWCFRSNWKRNVVSSFATNRQYHIVEFLHKAWLTTSPLGVAGSPRLQRPPPRQCKHPSVKLSPEGLEADRRGSTASQGDTGLPPEHHQRLLLCKLPSSSPTLNSFPFYPFHFVFTSSSTVRMEGCRSIVVLRLFALVFFLFYQVAIALLQW